ncbi:molybdenum cofactor guanylyltransferase [Paenisporosarcina antarctica]|uniref:Molybdenum cofactor guanylyltransferase n=1 Tax=Paenisporosarcina antarctica TaxID=417367 RepID=A0A4P6ZXA0_9BACL|nr:molybdenum cofactor guanylyltransferase [Paenisporosarcina antarctica]QBP41071.1 molybdenum cofactor guanylyltransferase [Paenisporosarcina antarctica]
METVGILLAGGMSRRFGSPKAFACINDKFFYEHVRRALDAVCNHVVIVTREELVPRFPKELDVIIDLPSISGLGPLAGIYTAMTERPAVQYLVLPCDMPFIGQKETSELIQLAEGTNDVTAVRTTSVEYIPLFSIWNHHVKKDLKREVLNKQLSVMKFLDKVETKWVDSELINFDKTIFRNINTTD